MVLNVISCEFLDFIKESLLKVCESNEVYNGDGTFNRLQIEDYEYNGLNIKEAQNKVKENIKKQKGLRYKNIESSCNILIDKKTVNEFVYSKYTKNQINSIKYVKYKLSKYLKELIENGKDKIFTNYKKEKHIMDAKYGFYKYKVIFSIVENNVEIIYEGIVLIRNSYDGKKYLYDILDIKQIKKQELTSA